MKDKTKAKSSSTDIRINTLLITFFRGAGILCSFLIVPLTIKYLNAGQYGVWLTLSSMVAWLSFMDIGLGNGLRNKLAEAVGNNKKLLAKEYTSTTYVAFGVLILILICLFLSINPFLDWNSILQVDYSPSRLNLLTHIVVITFCFRLWIDLAGVIIIALQKPYLKVMTDFLVSLFSLISVYILTISPDSSLVLFGTVICIIPIVILVVFSYFLFRANSPYHYLLPSIKFFRKDHIRPLLNLGVQFFIIQLAVLIVFSTDNILITQFFSPNEVTSFNIAYKYFSVVSLGFSIVVMPYWSAFTNAFVNQDIKWIKQSFKKLLFIWVLQIFLVILMIFIADYAYNLWVGPSIRISRSLNVFLGIYVILGNWNNIFSFFLNGVSKIRLQLYNAVFVGLINIPLSYYLAKHTTLGLSAIALANALCLVIWSVLGPIQCYKLVNNTAKGIWYK